MRRALVVAVLVVGLLGMVTVEEATATHSGCKTIGRAIGIKNGLGQVVARFVGHLEWCWRDINGSQSGGHRVWAGRFWVTEDTCCFWFYEGIVAANNGGCFNGCSYVSRYRKGSFIFNPPWPAITTRYQPWVRLQGNADGSYSTSAGD
jgi:hypothetical protein